MVTLEEVRQIVGNVLHIGSRIDAYDRDTQLLGSVPEFDSMAVVSVIMALEENFGIAVNDDEIQAEIFENLGNLQDFVSQKISAQSL